MGAGARSPTEKAQPGRTRAMAACSSARVASLTCWLVRRICTGASENVCPARRSSWKAGLVKSSGGTRTRPAAPRRRARTTSAALWHSATMRQWAAASQGEQLGEERVGDGGQEGHRAGEQLAEGAVEGNEGAGWQERRAGVDGSGGTLELQGAGGDDAGDAEGAGDHGGVRGQAAALRDDADAATQGRDVVGRGIDATKDDRLAAAGAQQGVVRIEREIAGGQAG